ncbi:DUF4383 domain-containing protein [Amycolatopsis sp. A133]|uniref:DUF4383 domain-containing protein n=1 Tax=Amycolatopsis sp. A133 TaxID=3064472 RepID=UPI0027EEA5F5|nr:DUF4383 domain-containing protein [Amycolatopsis sp. A133]MDQ7809319.1 DUF4383 domain-containing protein [Amycolatopsis sp. A133]
MSTPTHTRGRTPVQVAAAVVAVVFLLVGVLGFIPGVTTDYDQMSFAGHDSMAMLLGLFMVSVLHNIVHLLFGVVGLAAARTPRGARLFLLAGGAVYLVLWLYGLLIDHGSDANFVPVNTADNWLHLVLGIGMIALGLLTARAGRTGAGPHAARGPGLG